MIDKLVAKWEKNKSGLETVLRGLDPDNTDYEDLFKLVVEHIFNAGEEKDYYQYDIDKLTVIDHEQYQGTRIFILPTIGYSFDPKDYIWCAVYYGSCSGCDNLQHIFASWVDYETNEVHEQAVADLMTLCLHMVQETKLLDPEEQWKIDSDWAVKTAMEEVKKDMRERLEEYSNKTRLYDERVWIEIRKILGIEDPEERMLF